MEPITVIIDTTSGPKVSRFISQGKEFVHLHLPDGTANHIETKNIGAFLAANAVGRGIITTEQRDRLIYAFQGCGIPQGTLAHMCKEGCHAIITVHFINGQTVTIEQQCSKEKLRGIVAEWMKADHPPIILDEETKAEIMRVIDELALPESIEPGKEPAPHQPRVVAAIDVTELLANARAEAKRQEAEGLMPGGIFAGKPQKIPQG